MNSLTKSIITMIAAFSTSFGAEPQNKVDLTMSRGLKILKDNQFFDGSYDEARRKSLEIIVEYRLHDQQDINNFFQTKPKISAITKKHGMPDLIIYGLQKYAKKGEDFWITHYFDRIGLITTSKDPDTVIYTQVQLYDFSISNRSRKGYTFDFVGSSNDKILFIDGKEVGRHIYREDESWITDGQIPNGSFACFRDDKKIVETEIKDDSGYFRSYYPSGQIKWISQFKNGRLHGYNKMYSEKDKVLIHNEYAEGLLHGECVEYDEAGEVVGRHFFQKGEEQKSDKEKLEPKQK